MTQRNAHPILDLAHLSADLGGKKVLVDVSAQFCVGELVCIVGPNGAGKTSLLRAALGLLPAQAGSAAIEGIPLGHVSSRQRARRISYMAQGAPAFWPLNVEVLVSLGRMPHMHAWSRLTPEDKAAIDAALERTGTSAFRGRLVTQLSGGEKARVMLARALASEAPCLLVDEPAASLDPRYQLEMMALLKAEAKVGKCVLVVMHDLALAARYSDRVIVMQEGQIVADGAPDAVLSDATLAQVFGVRAVRHMHEGQTHLSVESI